MENKSELACTYAALILADDDIEVTGMLNDVSSFSNYRSPNWILYLGFLADKINTLLKAANCKFVEPFMSSLFASALTGRNIKDIVSSASTVCAAPAASAAAPSGGASAAAAQKPQEEKKEEKKEESEESDGDMGFDLFG